MKDKHKTINGHEKWELKLNQNQSKPELETLSWNEILSTECISLSILPNLPNITDHQIAIIALIQATAFHTENSTKRAKLSMEEYKVTDFSSNSGIDRTLNTVQRTPTKTGVARATLYARNLTNQWSLNQFLSSLQSRRMWLKFLLTTPGTSER